MFAGHLRLNILCLSVQIYKAGRHDPALLPEESLPEKFEFELKKCDLCLSFSIYGQHSNVL